MEMAYGAILKQIREQKGWTLEEVAKQLRHRGTWLSRIENGQLRLETRTFVELCRIYGVKPERIIRMADQEPTRTTQAG
jgi:transcriptional regulator with XRE-family HTH domain